MKKLETKYFFSVEGNTEKLYLKHLEELLNRKLKTVRVKFDIQITSSPEKRVRSIPVKERHEIYHLCDYESNDSYHQQVFYRTIDNLLNVKTKSHLDDYYLCYSNYTFELWLILHKTDAFSSISHRSNYLKYINKLYKCSFRSLNEFKRKENVLKILKQITLEDVLDAINREKIIEQHYKNNGYNKINYKGYSFFRENPSSSIGINLERILKELKIL